MKRVQFILTRKHVEAGIPSNSSHCAVALAVKERFDKSRYLRISVSSGMECVLFKKRRNYIFAKLSKRMMSLVREFDDRQMTKLDAPVKFYLNIPDDVAESMK